MSFSHNLQMYHAPFGRMFGLTKNVARLAILNDLEWGSSSGDAAFLFTAVSGVTPLLGLLSQVAVLVDEVVLLDRLDGAGAAQGANLKQKYM